MIEVRSQIDSRAIQDTLAKAIELNQLKRYYEPTDVANHLFEGDKLEDVQQGIPAGESSYLEPGPPLVPTMLVGFESKIKAKTAKMQIYGRSPWSVLCVGEYYAWHHADSSKEPGDPVPTRLIDSEECNGNLCISFWLSHLISYISSRSGCDALFQPDYERYFCISDSVLK